MHALHLMWDLHGAWRRDNLDADFKHWHGRRLQLGRDLFGMRDLLQHRNVGVVAIKNNVVYVFRNSSSSDYTVVRVRGELCVQMWRRFHTCGVCQREYASNVCGLLHAGVVARSTQDCVRCCASAECF